MENEKIGGYLSFIPHKVDVLMVLNLLQILSFSHYNYCHCIQGLFQESCKSRFYDFGRSHYKFIVNDENFGKIHLYHKCTDFCTEKNVIINSAMFAKMMIFFVTILSMDLKIEW